MVQEGELQVSSRLRNKRTPLSSWTVRDPIPALCSPTAAVGLEAIQGSEFKTAAMSMDIAINQLPPLMHSSSSLPPTPTSSTDEMNTSEDLSPTVQGYGFDPSHPLLQQYPPGLAQDQQALRKRRRNPSVDRRQSRILLSASSSLDAQQLLGNVSSPSGSNNHATPVVVIKQDDIAEVLAPLAVEVTGVNTSMSTISTPIAHHMSITHPTTSARPGRAPLRSRNRSNGTSGTPFVKPPVLRRLSTMSMIGGLNLSLADEDPSDETNDNNVDEVDMADSRENSNANTIHDTTNEEDIFADENQENIENDIPEYMNVTPPQRLQKRRAVLGEIETHLPESHSPLSVSGCRQPLQVISIASHPTPHRWDGSAPPPSGCIADSEWAANPWFWEDYGDDVLAHWIEIQARHQRFWHYSGQPDVSYHHRATLLSWMMHEAFMVIGMSSESFHAAVCYLDRFMTKYHIEQRLYQCAGIAAMMIAGKRDESSLAYSPAEMSSICREVFSTGEIAKMEIKMLGVLDFDLTTASTCNFGHYFIYGLHPTEFLIHMIKFLCDLSLMSPRLLEHLPSHVAAAAVVVCIQTLEPQKSGDTGGRVGVGDEGDENDGGIASAEIAQMGFTRVQLQPCIDILEAQLKEWLQATPGDDANALALLYPGVIPFFADVFL